MSDYIDRRAAIDAVAKGLKGVFVEYHDVAEKLLDNVPSVQPNFLWKLAYEKGKRDAQSQRMRGRWIDKSEGRIEGAWPYCSVCDDMSVERFDFCPNCGADMRGTDDDD